MAEMHAVASEKLFAVFIGAAGRAFALEAAFVQARKDGVILLEVGEDAWSLTLHGGSADAVCRALREAHQAGGANPGRGFRLVLDGLAQVPAGEAVVP